MAEAAGRLGLTAALSQGLAGMRERRIATAPGRVVRDRAVMLADGGHCLADLRAVRDREPLFGEVASDATAFRVILGSPPTPRCWTRRAPLSRAEDRGTIAHGARRSISGIASTAWTTSRS